MSSRPAPPPATATAGSTTVAPTARAPSSEPCMLPAMLPRRVQPLAGWSIVVVFALIGAALLATVWSTRASILDASDAVRCGQADAVEQAVRAELSDLDGPPTSTDLGEILHGLHDDGLRYLAMLERSERGGEGSDGSAVGSRGRALRGIDRSAG